MVELRLTFVALGVTKLHVIIEAANEAEHVYVILFHVLLGHMQQKHGTPRGP